MNMMLEHGQQKLNKGNPSNMLKTPFYRVSNFLIYSTLQFPTKVCSNQHQGTEWLLIGNGLFSFKTNLSQYYSCRRLPLSPVETNQRLSEATCPIPKRWDVSQKVGQTIAGHQPSLSTSHREEDSMPGLCCAPSSQILMVSKTKPSVVDTPLPPAAPQGTRAPHIGRTDSIQVQLTLPGKIKPQVTRGQLNVFQKNDIIKSMAVQEHETSKGGTLQNVSDCSCVFARLRLKGRAL